jgi:hypothetical protein
MNEQDKHSLLKIQILSTCIQIGDAMGKAGIVPDLFSVAALRYHARVLESIIARTGSYPNLNVTMAEFVQVVSEEHKKHKDELDFIIQDLGMK